MGAGASRRHEIDDGLGVDGIGKIIRAIVREHVVQEVREQLPLLLKGDARRPQALPPENLSEEYLTRKEAAKIAKCTVRTLKRYIDTGDLRPCGRRRELITRVELDRFLKAADVEPVRTDVDPDADVNDVVARLLGKK
jgi:hypothetical protein